MSLTQPFSLEFHTKRVQNEIKMIREISKLSQLRKEKCKEMSILLQQKIDWKYQDEKREKKRRRNELYFENLMTE